MRKRLGLFLYAATGVYTAALCGWQLNASDNLLIIISCLIVLAGQTVMAYGTIQERENQ
ncbi:hypothetical protein [Corynebacterium singulare]|uniref:hypothetical protein n=1 Tax=Corynebacterium singulare TaxID=161899 RepID=UPI00164253E4|nr:hypothetical protein [Corynebacterium singulare]